jgi:UDP-N-acetylglucosamine--N-acetylmuramyl-(pentapeptide) pyrophosphoryl-undecaprenol N-acetylglucosamine transferase
VVIAGGGTGGHVFPALALADELVRALPDASVLFIGSAGGLEGQLVPQHGYDLELLPSRKLRGAGAVDRLAALSRLPLAVLSAGRALRRHLPDVVVGLGGFNSAPVVLAATATRVPVVLLEQNAVPGVTNRLLAHLSTRVVIAFRRAAHHLPADRSVLLGNPVRRSVAELARQPLERGNGPPCLLVLGGSQGASPVNALVLAAAPVLKQAFPDLRMIHQAGPADADTAARRYAELGVDAEVIAFIDDMAGVYRRADLVVGRSGATTLAELAIVGLPAVLIPYPHAADDHQAENAAELVEAGAAIMVRQETLNGPDLGRKLVALLSDRERLQSMGAAMKTCGHPDAAEAIVELVRSFRFRD